MTQRNVFLLVMIIQNPAARVLNNTKKVEHVTAILRSLHWLPVSQRINFKILLLVFKALHGLGRGIQTPQVLRYRLAHCSQINN